MKLRLLVGLVMAILVIGLPAMATPSGVFTDDDGLQSEQHLERLFEIGVVLGCGGDANRARNKRFLERKPRRWSFG